MSDVLARIYAKVRVTQANCWEFHGSRVGLGYGRIGWNGRLWLTHRVTYTLLVGEIPEDREIDHLCKNPPCCNPAHLEAVTRSVNIQRGTQWHHVILRESGKGMCPAGHAYSSENTYVTPSGHRQCRACKREAGERYAHRNREAIAARARAWRQSKKEAA